MDANAIEKARARLAAIDGVVAVLIDPATEVVALVCNQPIQRGDVEDDARAILDEVAGEPTSNTIEVAYRAEHRERARVRFGEMHKQQIGGNVRVDVELEWGDATFTGSATGEPGSPLELRTAGQATLNALTTIAGELDL